MEAVKFIEEWTRMCKTINNCNECGIRIIKSDGACRAKVENNPEEAVAIVEKWSAEHPVKTRQSEFLKTFPNASIGINGALVIAPCNVDKKFESEICGVGKCEDCKKEYWLTEVE